jgi:hypothetical protein
MMSKYFARFLGACIAAVAAMALVAPLAQAVKPAPPYERFAGCPTPAENPAIEICVHSVVTGGHFQMGNKDVTIEKPIPLTGGVEDELKGFSYNSEGGLKPVKQKVPGGVIGLTGLTWLAEFLGVEALTLYAVTELAGQPQLGLNNIALPIKVHLINPVLGNKCYVGSNSSPINLHLTTGTTSPPPPNSPITGKEPTASFDEETNVLSLNGATFVDNSFAAPAANGCTLTLLGFLPISLNGAVNSQSGLPSAAGKNETIQNINTELAPSVLVYP